MPNKAVAVPPPLPPEEDDEDELPQALTASAAATLKVKAPSRFTGLRICDPSVR
ncbi:MAG: hypothetical protein NVSMB51_12110 [Solirubrobacteraceae bacterium]